MVHMISWGQAKNNDVINVTFGKTIDPWPFEILQGHFSNEMAKTSIGTNERWSAWNTIDNMIPRSDVYVVTCTLGCDDGTSPRIKVEGMLMIVMQNVERCHHAMASPHHQFFVPHP
jgi:hypothetical protein